jgi:hypothetical protein
MLRVIAGAVGIMGLMLAVSGAAAQTISCGDILGPGKSYTLTADLVCDTGLGLTVRDGAKLDLASGDMPWGPRRLGSS